MSPGCSTGSLVPRSSLDGVTMHQAVMLGTLTHSMAMRRALALACGLGLIPMRLTKSHATYCERSSG